VEGVGDKLVMIAQSPSDVLGNLHVIYEISSKPFSQGHVIFTVEFRTTPDEQPVKKATTVIATKGDPVKELGEAARQLGLRTAGEKKPIQHLNNIIVDD